MTSFSGDENVPDTRAKFLGLKEDNQESKLLPVNYSIRVNHADKVSDALS